MALPLRTSTLLGILALTLWGCILSAGVVLYVRYSSPTQLAAVITQKLTEETQLDWSIHRATVGFLPRPHIQLSTVSLQHPALRMDVSGVTAFMSWSGLLSLSFMPGHIALDSPVLTWNMDAPSSAPQLLPRQTHREKPALFTPAGLSDIARDMRLTIQHGNFVLIRADTRAAVKDINASVRLPGLFAGSLDLDFSALAVSRQEQSLGTLSAFRLRAQNIIPPEEGTIWSFETGTMEASLTLPEISERLDLRLHLAAKENAPFLTGLAEVQGKLIASPAVPLRLHLPFAFTPQGVELREARLDLDRDAVSLHADVTLGDWRPVLADMHIQAEKNFFENFKNKKFLQLFEQIKTKGTAHIHHLSLPRWFEFARKLPTGIETSLNELTGDLDFVLTPRSLDVPRLQAEVRGIPFSGTGDVKDFFKPNIRIAVHADTVNANTLFPELIQQAPTAIVWAGPPPVRQDDTQEGPDYDIQLTAANADAWKFAVRQLAFRCTPIPKGSRLVIDAKNFYDGTLTSTVDIADQVTVTAALTHTALEKPAGLVAGDPMLGGHLTGKAVLTGSDTSFDHFLASLSGTVQGQITQGWLAARGGGARHAFDSLDFTFKASGPGLAQLPIPATLPYTGEWKAGMRASGWEGVCTLSGALILDTSTVAVRHAHDVPGKLQWSANGLAVDLDARFDFDQAKETLSIRNASGKMSGGRLSGSLTGSNLLTAPLASSPPSASSGPLWQGTLDLTTTALRSILRQRGLLPLDMPEGTLQHLQLRGNFSLDEHTFHMHAMSGTLDDTTFSGTFVHAPDEAFTWQTSLKLGTLNLSRYLPKSHTGPGAVPWSTKILSGISARGVISLDNMIIAKLVQRSVRLPFVLEKNVLTCNPITFAPYNGKGEGELRVEASPSGYRTRLRYAANKMDAALFSREANFKTVLGGTAALNADISGLLRQGADFPASLDGNWSVNATQGYIADKKSDGSLDKPIPFRGISASGVMKQGILHTQDVNLSGNELAAKGSAKINLVDWTLDCRLHVSTKNFSDVPVTYTGSLDAPERSVNALNAVAGAIGKLGSGLYGLLEDVLSSPLRLLR